MVYDVYKHLIENEEQILQDLSMLKYIKADLDSCVSVYIDRIIQDVIPDATAEEYLIVKQDTNILKFTETLTETLRRMLHGNTDTLH